MMGNCLHEAIEVLCRITGGWSHVRRDIALIDSLCGQPSEHGCQGLGIDVLG